jgi:hypothetical protein
MGETGLWQGDNDNDKAEQEGLTMARRRTIGASPLDAVVPMGRLEDARRGSQPTQPAKAPKERVTFQLPVDVIEQARNAVFWTPGATMSALMEEALTAHLERLEKKRGEAFPARSGALRTGRPVKAA